MNDIAKDLEYATGSASYDPETYTLTLTDFSLDMSHEGYPQVDGEYCGIYYKGYYYFNLNIVLKGTNKIYLADTSDQSKKTIGIKLDKASVYFKPNGDSPKFTIKNTHTGIFIDQPLYANNRFISLRGTEVTIDTYRFTGSNTVGIKSTSRGTLQFYMSENAKLNVVADIAVEIESHIYLNESTETTGYELNFWGKNTYLSGGYADFYLNNKLSGFEANVLAARDFAYPSKGSTYSQMDGVGRFQDLVTFSSYKYVGAYVKPLTGMNTSANLLALNDPKNPCQPAKPRFPNKVPRTPLRSPVSSFKH